MDNEGKINPDCFRGKICIYWIHIQLNTAYWPLHKNITPHTVHNLTLILSFHTTLCFTTNIISFPGWGGE